jgi:hypothetical protein
MSGEEVEDPRIAQLALGNKKVKDKKKRRGSEDIDEFSEDDSD